MPLNLPIDGDTNKSDINGLKNIIGLHKSRFNFRIEEVRCNNALILFLFRDILMHLPSTAVLDFGNNNREKTFFSLSFIYNRVQTHYFKY